VEIPGDGDSPLRRGGGGDESVDNQDPQQKRTEYGENQMVSLKIPNNNPRKSVDVQGKSIGV
jgi:hypothetical protein